MDHYTVRDYLSHINVIASGFMHNYERPSTIWTTNPIRSKPSRSASTNRRNQTL